MGVAQVRGDLRGRFNHNHHYHDHDDDHHGRQRRLRDLHLSVADGLVRRPVRLSQFLQLFQRHAAPLHLSGGHQLAAEHHQLQLVVHHRLLSSCLSRPAADSCGELLR
ncbi:hypothetical protein FJT64_010158 [Amphibalanus amphitrite]|uniref:Uncharacterized protein n=1 Tax=Amphibalanus amphitrite TaxID=1232801 RepID=A0A6A4VKD7_AMPAM|nr:hypothetical protein FJT64_010158 [Amphibalanus amphitrite]